MMELANKHLFYDLSNESAGILIKSVLKYIETDEVPVINDVEAKISFRSIRGYLDADTEKYNAICERNRINGLKGGRPPGDNPKNPLG